MANLRLKIAKESWRAPVAGPRPGAGTPQGEEEIILRKDHSMMFYPDIPARRLSPWTERSVAAQNADDLRFFLARRLVEVREEMDLDLNEVLTVQPFDFAKGPWDFLLSFSFVSLEEGLKENLSSLFMYEDTQNISYSLSGFIISMGLTQHYLRRVGLKPNLSLGLRCLSDHIGTIENLICKFEEGMISFSFQKKEEIKDLILARPREACRPLCADEVSRSISLQASEQPAYGEQIASDLGNEIVSYL